MGQFANTLFSMLLGWVQSAAQWLWQKVSGADAGAMMQWVLDNWLALLVLLCLGGMLIDLVVYLFRWQPYRVWRSFFARLTGSREEDSAPVSSGYRQWVYADGSTRLEEIPQEERQEENDHLDAPIRPVRRAVPSQPDNAYNQPVYPPQWSGKGLHGGQE